MVLAGLSHHCCVIGNNFSVEIKLSRHSLMVFEICKHFQIIIYELPFINLPAQSIPSAATVNEAVELSHQDVNTEIKYVYIADDSIVILPKVCETALADTVKWYTLQVESKSDNPFSKKLEAVLLALIYDRYGCKEKKEYNWHIVVSEVYDPREAHIHTIFTNHSQVIYAASNL